MVSGADNFCKKPSRECLKKYECTYTQTYVWFVLKAEKEDEKYAKNIFQIDPFHSRLPWKHY